jgi:hypothetical protein
MTAVTLTVMPPTATSMTEPVVLYKPYTARQGRGYQKQNNQSKQEYLFHLLILPSM